jgi:hypothetical protein
MRHTLFIAAGLIVGIATAHAAGADDVLQAYKTATGGPSWDNKATLKTDFSYAGQGLTGTTSSLADLKDGRFVDSYAIGPLTGAQGYDGRHAWAKDQSGTVTTQDGGDAAVSAVNESYRDANLWWHPDHGGATLSGPVEKSDGGAAYEVLTITPKGGETFDAWFNVKTHLLERVIELQGTALTTTNFSDYRVSDGVMLPHKWLISTGNAKYDQTQTLTNAMFLPAQEETAYVAPKVSVKDFSIAGGAPEASFPFELLNNHIYALVKIEGKGPYKFIFDTGGVNAVVPALARQIGLKIEGHFEARGAGGGTLDSGFAKVSRVDLGSASVLNQTFAAVPLDTLADVEGVDEYGMIGFETFRRFVTRIDYGAHTITLMTPGHFDPAGAGTPVPIVFDGNIPETNGSYNGIAGKFMIDTGARGALVLTVPFIEKNNLRARSSRAIEATTGWGVGGPTRSFVERSGVLKIGDVAVKMPVTEFSTDKEGATAIGQAAGNIGAGILKRFVVTFDYEHDLMYLKPISPPVADLDSFDRAGLWMNRDPSGFKIVDVPANTPASEAGLKQGDIVLAVDGRDAGTIQLPTLRVRLRNDPVGTTVALTIKRAGKRSQIKLVLRDLI